VNSSLDAGVIGVSGLVAILENYRGQNNIKLSFSQLINAINETTIIVLLVVGKADALIF
jgi:hypothetical protein